MWALSVRIRLPEQKRSFHLVFWDYRGAPALPFSLQWLLFISWFFVLFWFHEPGAPYQHNFWVFIYFITEFLVIFYLANLARFFLKIIYSTTINDRANIINLRWIRYSPVVFLLTNLWSMILLTILFLCSFLWAYEQSKETEKNRIKNRLRLWEKP